MELSKPLMDLLVLTSQLSLLPICPASHSSHSSRSMRGSKGLAHTQPFPGLCSQASDLKSCYCLFLAHQAPADRLPLKLSRTWLFLFLPTLSAHFTSGALSTPPAAARSIHPWKFHPWKFHPDLLVQPREPDVQDND